MNALGLYLSTCRYVMSAEPDNKESWEDLYRYLPYLRQALSCCVCRNIMIKPMGPVHNVCQHFVCFNCVGGKMKLKPQCSWCKNHDEFKENVQLRLVVICFHKLCEYISNSFIGEEISAISTPNGEKNNLLLIIQEALSVEDDFKFTSSINTPVLPPLPVVKKLPVGQEAVNNKVQTDPVPSTSKVINITVKKTPFKWKSRRKKFAPYKSLKRSNLLKINTKHVTGDKKEMNNHEEIKNHIKTPNCVNETVDSGTKKKSDQIHVLSREEKNLQDCFSETANNSYYYSIPPLKKPKLIPASQSEIRICKCGRGGQNSRLTCLGQRCPCYIKRLPCIGCKCKGCRNPRKAFHLEPPLLVQETYNSVHSDDKKYVTVTS